MPLYMDTHKHVADLTAEGVEGAHQAYLATQEKYGVDYEQYWNNKGEGVVYCLVEAPDREAAVCRPARSARSGGRRHRRGSRRPLRHNEAELRRRGGPRPCPCTRYVRPGTISHGWVRLG